MPPKTTMNDEYYVSNLKILHQYISKKCHESVRNWILHYNIAHLHAAISVQHCLSKCHIRNYATFPLQSNIAKYDLWLFLMLNEKLLGRKLNTHSKVISAVQGSL